jgi:hypothetical protein
MTNIFNFFSDEIGREGSRDRSPIVVSAMADIKYQWFLILIAGLPGSVSGAVYLLFIICIRLYPE